MARPRTSKLPVGLPIGFSRSGGVWSAGAGDIEVAAKYRFYHDEKAAVSIALSPGMTLPTASNGMGNRKVTGLLPIWLQKDFGPWSVFGGGGYAINPGAGNRDYWTGGVAVTREVGAKAQLGFELNRQGPNAVGEKGSTSLGVGGVHEVVAPFRILASGGPTFAVGSGQVGYHFFLALAADF